GACGGCGTGAAGGLLAALAARGLATLGLGLGALRALGLFLLALGTFLGEGHAGGLGRDDGLLGVGVGGEPRRRVVVGDRDRLADLEIAHVDGQGAGDVGRLARDDDRVEGLLDDALFAVDLLGLALEDDRDLDVDRLVGVDLEKVDVEHVAAHRVALELL